MNACRFRRQTQLRAGVLARSAAASLLNRRLAAAPGSGLTQKRNLLNVLGLAPVGGMYLAGHNSGGDPASERAQPDHAASASDAVSERSLFIPDAADNHHAARPESLQRQ